MESLTDENPIMQVFLTAISKYIETPGKDGGLVCTREMLANDIVEILSKQKNERRQELAYAIHDLCAEKIWLNKK